MNIKVIGVGGIGSHLLLPLVQYLHYPSNSEHELDEILLIDGDKFEEKNKTRQFVPEIGQFKAESTVRYFKQKYPELNIHYSNSYISESNIQEYIKEKDIVLLCVDNNATRKLIDEYIKEEMNDVILVTGGNEYTDGNAQIVFKYNGLYLSPSLVELHPEVADNIDKNPADMSCEELAQDSQSQLSIVNAGVADAMRRMLMGILSEGITYYETYLNFNNGNIRNVFSEDKQLLKYVW